MNIKLIALAVLSLSISAFAFFDTFDYGNLSQMQQHWNGTYELILDPIQGDGQMARISNGGNIAGGLDRTATPAVWSWSINSPNTMGNYQGVGIFNSDGTRFVQFLFDQGANVKIWYKVYDDYGASLELPYTSPNATLNVTQIAGIWVVKVDNTNGLTVLWNGKTVYTNTLARLPQDMTMHFEFKTHYGGSAVDINWVQGGSPEILQADEFNSSLVDLDTAYWTKTFGSYYQNGKATHEVSGSWGGSQGGFQSTCIFGGLNNGELTLDFLGVKERTSSSSNDNWWGLWTSLSSGIKFGNNGSSQAIRVVVGSTSYTTGFLMTVGTLYDFRIVWTPGVRVEFFEKTAGASSWTSLYSATSGVPDTPYLIQVRDETVGLDIRRITLLSTPVVEPASSTIDVNLSSTYNWVSLAGFLHGVYVATEDQIRAVAPKYWRSYPTANYQTLKNVGIDTSAEFSYLVNGQQVPVDSTNRAQYVTYVTNHYHQAADNASAIGYTVKYWEFWSEGEGIYVWDPMSRGETVDKMEREYYAFKVFYDTIRQLQPDAKIVAPSSCHYWPDLMDDFLRRCSLDGVRLDAVSWHVIDVQPQELQAQVDNMTAILNKYPNLGVTEIHINEWGWPSILPGAQMNFFYYMGKAGVDIASKSIWGYEPLDDLIMDNGNPAVPYWAWEFYANMGPVTYLSTTDYPNTVALAGTDKTDSSITRLIVARERKYKEYTSDSVPLKKAVTGLPIDITVNVTSVPDGPMIVQTVSLPASKDLLTEGMLSSLTLESNRTVTGGQTTLSFPQVNDEQVFLIQLMSERALVFYDGFESNDFTAGDWIIHTCSLQSTYQYAGTYASIFNYSDNLTKALDTTGKKSIEVRYARLTRNCQTNHHFIVEWYDGTTWFTLEDLTGNSAWTAKSFHLPSGANNNPNFKLRFRTSLNGSTNYAYLDEVKIFATSMNLVQGSVELQDFPSAIAGKQVSIEIRNPGELTPVETDNVTLDGTGHFTFYTNLSGSYDLTAKASHWLKQKKTGINLHNATVDFSLINGDCNGDNDVTPTDLSFILATMDTGTGGLGWDEKADLDGDGEITSTDLSIVLANMDIAGDQ
ncbi:MAG: dockerin type I domain-containing protein [Phycisphaerae bacterium]